MSKKPRDWTAADLPELDGHLTLIDGRLRNLARTFGAFHGFNDRLADRTVRGPGSATVGTIMFDQLHLMAIRIQALIAEPKFATDVSLQTFRRALAIPEIRRHLADRAEGWLGPSFAIEQRRRTEGRIMGIERRFARIERIGPQTLATVRNKLLAHITTEVDPIPKLGLGDLWTMTRLALTIGHELHLVFQGNNTRYAAEVKEARSDAAALLGHLRARIRDEDNSRLARLRRARDRTSGEGRAGAAAPPLPDAGARDRAPE